jgi:di/tricarboxylate transporter
VDVLWSQWFLAYLPCDLITIFAAWRVTLWLYPPERQNLPGGKQYLNEELAKMGSWNTMEIKSIALMGVALALWVTDFVHHISPSLIGLGIGLLATMPVMRLLTVEDVKKMNYLPVFFVGAAISMGNVLSSTKTLDLLTDVVFSWMSPLITGVWTSTVILYWFAFVYHMFLASEISMLGTSIPLLMNFAKEHGLDPLALGMIWTFAAGGKIFIYQSGVIITGYSYGYFRSSDMLKMGLALTVVESLILLLLVPLYWPLIGI